MSKKLVETGVTKLCRTRPCMIITTLHESGIVNAGTFGAYTNLGPEEIGIAIGKSGHTYRNIKRTEEFVINVPHLGIASALEVCGLKIPETESELDRAGLGTEPAAKIATPLIKECVSNIECRYWQEVDMGHHMLVLAKVVCGHIEEEFIDVDGGLDVIKARVPFGIRYPDPLYATFGEVTRVDEVS